MDCRKTADSRRGDSRRRRGSKGRDRARVLLVGLNGVNNTGAEARVLAAIDDVRAALGPETFITVPSLDVANTRRYVHENADLRVVPVPSLYFAAVRRLVREHDLILLVEGSVYMDTWTSFLLWYFLWATRCARAFGKPCMAYAVDVGEVSRFNRRLVRREASKTDLLVTRTYAAAETLRSWGVTAPMDVAADTALTMRTDPADEGWVRRAWPEAEAGLVGFSVVDFYLWPLVFRLWGPRERRYRWPYFFSRSPERLKSSADLAKGYAALADRIVTKKGKYVALICMEEVDEPLAGEVHRRMAHAGRARIFSAREHDASRMTALLRGLDLLVTSRYHASVLSLDGQVPQVAVGHDLRLKTLYDELGLLNEYFVDSRSPDMFAVLSDRVERLLTDTTLERSTLRRGYDDLMARARRNEEILRTFARAHGWTLAGRREGMP
jgi:polysaccharide pyruvyl transferase WcaK-like protein